jgi:hypothetical protein
VRLVVSAVGCNSHGFCSPAGRRDYNLKVSLMTHTDYRGRAAT